MLILAAVPDVQLHKLRRAAAARFSLARATSWGEALATIRSRPVELAVVDPLFAGSARAQEIERLRVLFPSLPLILYTSLSPETAAVLLTLGQRGIRYVVFARYDDHPTRLREVLGQEEGRAASHLFRGQLAEHGTAPERAAVVREEAFRRRTEFKRSVRSRPGRCRSRLASGGHPCRYSQPAEILARRAGFAIGSARSRLSPSRWAQRLGYASETSATRSRIAASRSANRLRDAERAGARRATLSRSAPRDVDVGGSIVTVPERTVLIVDDDATLRRVLERALSRDGYRVLSAGSAETAYTLLESQRPDALLLDIQLSTMSGLALYLAIVHRWPHLDGRIAIMTGDAEADEVRSWLEQNRCMVLRKPFDLREISAWLDHGLRSPQRELGNG